MQKKYILYTEPQDEGSSLSSFLRARMKLTKKEISRAKFRENGLLVDGERRKVTAILRAGQRVEVLLETGEQTSAQLRSSEKELDISYEDGDVLVLHKPAGLSAHPAGRAAFAGDSLANRIAFYLREKQEDGVIRIFGRLDRDTSGVVLAAKSRAAAARLGRQRESGALRKTYLALAAGVPEAKSGEIRAPLAPDPADRRRMRVCPEGKRALTCYEVLDTWRTEEITFSLVRLRLETGRTHQIRVHMAHIGCPLLGDPLYGEDSAPSGRAFISRAALHAAALDFSQPFTGEPLHIEAPLPKDIASLCGFMVECR